MAAPMAAEIIEFPRLPPRTPPAKVARIDVAERWNTGMRWGDLSASQLGSVLMRAERGDIADWSDLCDHMLEDDLLGSLHQTRVLRVTQSDWIIKPNEFGDPKLAELAAELVNELMGRIRGWSGAQKKLLHAIGAGFAAGQKIWEYDRQKRCYYVRGIEWVHNHRFTYDEQWQLRLYDRGGLHSRASMYGRALDPELWIVHRHQPNAGYPGRAGQLRQCAWVWLFRRWVDKFWIGGVERGGMPIIYAKVPKNTPSQTRDQIQSDLENLADKSVGVINDDVTIEAESAAAATKSWEAYESYFTASKERLVTNYLGASDVVTPGENGSQAALGARAGITVDPRMVDDGDSLSQTLQDQLFEGLIRWNAHLFGVPPDQIPIPEMRRKTADDEVKRDSSDRVTEIRDERAAGGGNIDPMTGKPLPGVMPPQLQAHAQAAADASADDIDDEEPEDDPKAGARASTRAGGSTQARWGTTGRCRTPLEQALSSESGASTRSCSKRSKKPPAR